MKGMKKTLYTLAVDNYEPEIRTITFPLLEAYARRIKADFYVIKERKFPAYPPVYEKFQLWDITRESGADWNIFFDADTLLHPDFFDVTSVIGKDITVSYGTDFVPVRFDPDPFFLRDRRWIGKGNWCLIASDWCRDVWHPLEDITVEEAITRIHPTVEELNCGIKPEHLIDDYIVSRNIARFGLKHMLIPEICASFGVSGCPFWHEYRVSGEKKVAMMREQLKAWGVRA